MWWEQKRGTRGESRVCHWSSYQIMTLSLIYYTIWTDARQHGIYLLHISKEQIRTLMTSARRLSSSRSWVHVVVAMNQSKCENIIWLTPYNNNNNNNSNNNNDDDDNGNDNDRFPKLLFPYKVWSSSWQLAIWFWLQPCCLSKEKVNMRF